MKNWKEWVKMDWYGLILLSMVIAAGIGFIIVFCGYLLIGNMITWSAVGVDCIAVIIRWKMRGRK